jgi:hypothetical protein
VSDRLDQRADTSGTPRRVEGRVVRGTRAGPQPVANQWVVLHRVGPDRAGPLDSTRTSASGAFAITYKTSGDTTALYFVSTSYGGVAYFTAPLRAPLVKGDDGLLTVFDTTSGPVAIKTGGHHLVIGAVQPTGMRPIGEVFDLQNDSTVTVIARDSVTPVWTTHIPSDAVAFQVNGSGEVAPGAVVRSGNTVGLFAPLSPGIRQFAFTYELPTKAFPLAVPIERPTGIVEVLVEEPTARVHGATLREVSPANTDGRTFRRFLGQDAPANSAVQIDVPRLIGAERQRVYFGVGGALLVAMIVALVFAARRSRRRVVPMSPAPAASAPLAEARSHALARTIADLDAEFERAAEPDDATRSAYQERRAALKAKLALALTDERR